MVVRCATRFAWKTGKKPVDSRTVNSGQSDSSFLKDTVTSFSAWQPVLTSRPGSLQVGDAAPDIQVVDLASETEVSLFSFLATLCVQRSEVPFEVSGFWV
jgi:hypothetical protein